MKSGGNVQIDLSERQRITIAAAVTILAACVIVFALGGLLWLVGAFVNRFSNVFLPLAVAGVAALVVKPYYRWLRSKERMSPVFALVVVYLSVLVPIVLFFWFFGALLFGQLSDLIAKMPEWWANLLNYSREHAPQIADFMKKYDVLAKVQEQQETIVQGLQIFGSSAILAGAGILRGIGGLLAWVVLPVYLSFFLLAEKQSEFELKNLLPFLKSETRNDVAYLVREFVTIVVAFFRGQLIIAFLQGMLFAVGFSVAGLKYGFVLGLMLGFLNIIPYLGSILGLGGTIPLAFFQSGGGLVLVVWVLVVFVVVQMIEGYVLTPRIMGKSTGLHPMAIIVAVFFWGSALGGIMGMILAIPLTAFLVVFWRLAREKYVKELV